MDPLIIFQLRLLKLEYKEKTNQQTTYRWYQFLVIFSREYIENSKVMVCKRVYKSLEKNKHKNKKKNVKKKENSTKNNQIICSLCHDLTVTQNKNTKKTSTWENPNLPLTFSDASLILPLTSTVKQPLSQWLTSNIVNWWVFPICFIVYLWCLTLTPSFFHCATVSFSFTSQTKVTVSPSKQYLFLRVLVKYAVKI